MNGCRGRTIPSPVRDLQPLKQYRTDLVNILYLTGPGTFCANITSQDILFPSIANLSSTAREIIANGGWANETTTLLHPVLNWIGSIKSVYIDFCQASSLDECYQTNTPYPFPYMQCTEYGLFATGYVPGSLGKPSTLPVASRLLTVDAALQNCKSTYNITSGPNVNSFNKYGGFNLSYPRLALSAGQTDIWRPAGPLAEEISLGVPNPRAGKNGTMNQPQIVIADGGHEWDLYGVFPNETNATVTPQAVKNAHQREIQAVKGWLEEWQEQHGSN
jgi:hypothetical protein